MNNRKQLYDSVLSDMRSSRGQAAGSGIGAEGGAMNNGGAIASYDAFDVTIEPGRNTSQETARTGPGENNLHGQPIELNRGNENNQLPLELVAEIMGSQNKVGGAKRENETKNEAINEKRIITLHDDVIPRYLKTQNRVSNTKYNIFSFIPLCIVSQFLDPLGAFFIVCALLEIFPPFRIGPLIGYLFPPIFCFLATVIVEGINDLRRRQGDKEENSRPVKIFKDNKVQEIKSGDLTVGDTVVLHDGESAGFNGIALLPFRREEEEFAEDSEGEQDIAPEEANNLNTNIPLTPPLLPPPPPALAILPPSNSDFNIINTDENVIITSKNTEEIIKSDKKMRTKNKNTLKSGNSNGKPINFYIRTDQLDGETDWKPRKCVFGSDLYSKNVEDINSIFVLDSYNTTTSYPNSNTGNVGQCIIIENNNQETSTLSPGTEQNTMNSQNDQHLSSKMICRNILNDCVIPCGAVLQSPEPMLVLMTGTNNMCPRPDPSDKKVSWNKIVNSFKGATSTSLRTDLSDKNIHACSGYVFGLIFLIMSLPMCILDCIYNDSLTRNSEFSIFTNIIISYFCSVMVYSVCLPASIPVCMKVARTVNTGSGQMKNKIKDMISSIKRKLLTTQGSSKSNNNMIKTNGNLNKKTKMNTIHTLDDPTKGTSVISLGRIGCLLSDKTGTLTTNEMHLFGYKKMEKGDFIEEEEVCQNEIPNEVANTALVTGFNNKFTTLRNIIPKKIVNMFNSNSNSNNNNNDDNYKGINSGSYNYNNSNLNNQQGPNINEMTEIDDAIRNNTSNNTEDFVDRNICSGAGICIINNGKCIPILDTRDQMKKRGKYLSMNIEGEDFNDNSDNNKKTQSDNITFRTCVKEFLLCNSVYVDGPDWGENATGLPKTIPTFRASSSEEVALAEFCYMNTSTTIAKREEKDVCVRCLEGSQGNMTERIMTVPCILTFEWPTNALALRNTNTVIVREYALLHVIPFNSSLKRMSVIVQRIKKYNVNIDNKEEAKHLWDTSDMPYNYGKIRVITKGADCAITPLITKRTNGNFNENFNMNMNVNHISLTTNALLQASNAYAKGGLRTLAFCEKILNNKEFAEVYKLIEAANNSSHTQEILKRINEIVPYESTASCVIGIEDKLQKGVRESIVNLRSAGIPVWMLTGDKQETALTVASQCGIIADAEHTYIFQEDTEGVDPLLTLAQRVNSPRRSTFGTTTVCATTADISRLQLRHLLPRFVSLLMKADGVVLCRLTPEQKMAVTHFVGNELKERDMAVCSIGDGGNDVKMIKEAEVGIGIVGKEGRMAALAADVAVSNFENAQSSILAAGYSAYYRYSAMWKVLLMRGLRLGFIFLFIVAASSHFVPMIPLSGLSSIFYSTIYTTIPLILIVWDYNEAANTKWLTNKFPGLKRTKRLPIYSSSKSKGLIKPSLYREQANNAIISLSTLVKLISITFVQALVIFAVLYSIYGKDSISSILLTLVCCCLWDCLEQAEKKTPLMIIFTLLSFIFTVIVLMFIDKDMPLLTFAQLCLSLVLMLATCAPLTFMRKEINWSNAHNVKNNFMKKY